MNYPLYFSLYNSNKSRRQAYTRKADEANNALGWKIDRKIVHETKYYPLNVQLKIRRTILPFFPVPVSHFFPPVRFNAQDLDVPFISRRGIGLDPDCDVYRGRICIVWKIFAGRIREGASEFGGTMVQITGNVIICLPRPSALLRLLKDAIRSGEHRASSGRCLADSCDLLYRRADSVLRRTEGSLNTQPIK